MTTISPKPAPRSGGDSRRKAGARRAHIARPKGAQSGHLGRKIGAQSAQNRRAMGAHTGPIWGAHRAGGCVAEHPQAVLSGHDFY